VPGAGGRKAGARRSARPTHPRQRALLNTLVNQMGESSIFRARIDQGVGAMSNNLNDLEQTIIRLRRQVTISLPRPRPGSSRGRIRAPRLTNWSSIPWSWIASPNCNSQPVADGNRR
jgi:hypothetical protein